MCTHQTLLRTSIGNIRERLDAFEQQILTQLSLNLFFRTQRRDVAFLEGGWMLGDTFRTPHSPHLFRIQTRSPHLFPSTSRPTVADSPHHRSAIPPRPLRFIFTLLISDYFLFCHFAYLALVIIYLFYRSTFYFTISVNSVYRLKYRPPLAEIPIFFF